MSVCSSVSLLKTSNNLASLVFAVGKQHPGLSIELICSVLTFQLKERPRLDSCTKKRNSRETKEKKKLKKAHNAEESGADPGFQFRKLSKFLVGVFGNV